MNKVRGKQADKARPAQGERERQSTPNSKAESWLAGWSCLPEKSGTIAASPECGAKVLLRTSNDFTKGARLEGIAHRSYSAHHFTSLAMLSTAARPAFRAGAAAMRYVRPPRHCAPRPRHDTARTASIPSNNHPLTFHLQLGARLCPSRRSVRQLCHSP